VGVDQGGSGERWAALGEGSRDAEPAVADLFVDARASSAGLVELEIAMHVGLPAAHHARLGTDAVEAFVIVERASFTGHVDEDTAAVADAIAIAVGVIEARLALARADRARIARLLAGADDHQLQLVLEWLATAPARTFTWPERGVLAGLAAWHAGSLHPGVASAAVDAVGRIGDARHVPALLARVSLVDDLQALRTYDTIASLGGPDAVAFLDFAARNERTLERRRAAQQALVSLEPDLEPALSEPALSEPTPSEPASADAARPPAEGPRGRRPHEFTSLRGHR
jgi:hypothetical protein